MIRKKARHISPLNWVLIGLTLLSVISLLLSYAAYYVSPATVWWLAFFGLAYPLILSLNLVFVLLWIILRKKYVWIPLIAILGGFSHVISLVQFRSNSSPPAAGSIKVLTYNVHGHVEYFKNPTRNGNLNNLVEYLAGQDADVICLQEFFINTTDTVNVLGRIADRLNLKHYYFRNYYQSRNNRYIDALIVFSRYPIVRTGYFHNEHKSTGAIFADISVDEEIVRIYNIHLESFQFAKEDYAFYSNLKEVETEKTPIKEGTMKIVKKLRKAYELRAKQVTDMNRTFKNSPYPILICGDLNDTPSSYTVQVLSKGRYDSFRRAGSGLFGETYRGSLPSYRIDYILLDKAFEAYHYERYDVDLSDHYPISAYINIHPAK